MKKTMSILSMMITAAMMCADVPLSVGAGGIREVNVSTTDELHAALADARPGDKIIIAPGNIRTMYGKGNGRRSTQRRAEQPRHR